MPCIDNPSQPTKDLAEIEQERPFFVTIDPKTGVLGALRKLDQQLIGAGEASIFSKKDPAAWIGHELTPGSLGLVNHGGLPKLLTKVNKMDSNWRNCQLTLVLLARSLPAFPLPVRSL